MNTLIEQLKNKRLIWQGNQQQVFTSTNSSGYAELDHALQGGFPQQGVIDIDSPIGIGELRLMLPALRSRQQQSNRLVVFIAAPMQINGEMLAEFGFALEQILILQPNSAEQALWSAEQCLKSGCCHGVLLWHKNVEIPQAKRLQLAAEQGDALQLIFRQDNPLKISLPIDLAMKLASHRQGISVQITKRKGGWLEKPFEVNMSANWPELTLPEMSSNVLSFSHVKVG
ncbi:translesion DNA synthesis-associated protein ImuA [Aliiglaciecola sp. LCG003]|uniref:translesion DNA synthesis-associated protein ImuA n=1 Tax=Aliiglaciecola sp. LCG003 TaxID=3053655 RepID=UPI002573A516|nr:translesion DNA synthesis-associated protein ImuA [Aliiglaciecola sp. LCG003]WJG09495.1 translesion DNA synthesis-associated protein ImuA [Aliiglaciecola sp. LCG003]